MNTEFSLLSIALAVGIIQGLFLVFILLFSKRQNQKANRYLATFIFAFTLLTLSDFLTESKLSIKFPHTFLLFDPIIFFLGPLAYFYVRYLTTSFTKFIKKDLFHFIIGFVFWLLITPFYFTSYEFKTKAIIESYQNRDGSIDFILLFATIHLLIYFIVSMTLINKYQKRIMDSFSYQERINLKWLQIFFKINLVLLSFFALSVFLNLQFLNTVNDILFTISMYLFGYFGFQQPEVFAAQILDTASVEVVKKIGAAKKKYASSNLTDEDLNKISSSLTLQMTENKYFLKCDLKLADLAEKTSIQAHQLSQVINEKFNKNFFDFINDYRIEEVKKRFSDPKFNNYTILAIGLDSGFNSKAAFNSAFKISTGVTPSEFRKKYLL